MATTPQLPNNTMRFPAGPIDFAAEVGITGQDHDNYPEAGTQPRYDWMRMALIALLAQQSSYEEPTQYREGTPWFDLNELALKIRKNGQWVPFAQAVLISEGYTLADFYAEYAATNSINVRFNGTATALSNTIDIPTDVAESISGSSDAVADVFINGVMVNPDNVTLGPNQVNLSGGIQVTNGDEYVVIIRNVISPQSLPFVLTSPNGTRFRVTVSNTGALSTVEI